VNSSAIANVDYSSEVAEMAAQCCTRGKWVYVIFTAEELRHAHICSRSEHVNSSFGKCVFVNYIHDSVSW